VLPAGHPVFGIAVFVIGAATGALLPRPAYRLSVDWGDPNLDRCGHCSTPFPTGIRGWLHLGGKCPRCAERNGPATGWMVGGVAVAAGGLALLGGPQGWLVPYLLLIPMAVLLGAIDLACLRLPERQVWPSIGVSVLAFALVALGTGQWNNLGRALLGALAFGGAYLLLAILPGGQIGLGDVTLAVLLGLYLGWIAWPAVLLGGLLPWVVQLPFAIRVLILRHGGRKTELPFGPAMLLGAYLTIVGPRILEGILN
jgi:leader peptidase (prepilin peptidase) / N-methyltransferase